MSKECGYAASQKGALEMHMEAVHKMILSHVCGDCQSAASYNRDLKKPVDGVHDIIRNFGHGSLSHTCSALICLFK